MASKYVYLICEQLDMTACYQRDSGSCWVRFKQRDWLVEMPAILFLNQVSTIRTFIERDASILFLLLG